MKRTGFNFTLIAIMVLLLSSCGTIKENTMKKTKATSSSITDNHWVLERLGAIEYEDMVVRGRKVGFGFDAEENRIFGFAGCNNFSGSYTLEGKNKIDFSRMMSTKMACPDSKFPEHLFMQAFGSVHSYKIKGDQLQFLDKKERVIAVFNKEVDFAHIIEEKYWKLTEMQGASVKMAANQEREVHFILKTDEERITGFSGCNHFTGSYKFTDKNGIEFSQLAGTLKACPDLEFDETAFLKLLENTKSFEQQGDHLILKEKDKILAEFEAVYF